MDNKVAIIGNGWVGKAMQELFPLSVTYVRDLNAAIGKGEILEDVAYTEDKQKVNAADFAFICVPTPAIGEGKLDVSAVEEVLKWCEVSNIIIRSTVNPGDCDRWQNQYPHKTILFQPEYLGETPNHPLLDTVNTPFIVIGGDTKEHTQPLIDLYTTVYNANTKIRQVTLLEAEVIKLSENRAIAWKVAQCQELYDVCVKAGVNYYTIREAVYSDDPRMNLWWTFVMPDKRGFQSKCIPKDVYAWCAWAESLGYPPVITRTMLAKNKEWMEIS